MEREYICENCAWKGNGYIKPSFFLFDIYFQCFPFSIIAEAIAGRKINVICPNCKEKKIKIEVKTALDDAGILPKIRWTTASIILLGIVIFLILYGISLVRKYFN